MLDMQADDGQLGLAEHEPVGVVFALVGAVLLQVDMLAAGPAQRAVVLGQRQHAVVLAILGGVLSDVRLTPAAGSRGQVNGAKVRLMIGTLSGQR